MIQEGKYQARAVKTALGLTSKDSEQIGVLFQIVGGDSDGSEITWFGYFSEKAIQRTIESLRHAGWAGSDLSVFTDADESTTEKLLPVDVQIVVEHEADNDGKTYAKVRWVNRLGGGSVAVKNKMDTGSARVFADRLRGACAAVAVTNKGTQEPRQPRQPAKPNQPKQQEPRGDFSEADYGTPVDNDGFPF